MLIQSVIAIYIKLLKMGLILKRCHILTINGFQEIARINNMQCDRVQFSIKLQQVIASHFTMSEST